MVAIAKHLHSLKFTFTIIWQSLVLNTSLTYYLRNFLQVYITM